MSRVLTWLVAMSVAVPLVSAQGPTRRVPPEQTGTSAIRGRVIAADTGRALSGVTVRLTGQPSREARTTTTDDQGRYELSNLPARRFYITASKEAFLPGFHARAANQAAEPVEVGVGQSVDSIDITLLRGAVITGRVVDKNGEPVVGSSVRLIRFDFWNGQALQEPSGSNGGATLDNGEYRVWGLQPGTYYVAVMPRRSGDLRPNAGATGDAPTFYPGTANVAGARPVAVVAGQTVKGIDVKLVTARLATVSGTVIDAGGRLFSAGNVVAMQRGLGGSQITEAQTVIRSDGRWTIPGLMSPGDYIVRANVARTMNAPGTTTEMIAATVRVAGTDVTGVVLRPVRVATLAGRFRFDPLTPLMRPAEIRISAVPKNQQVTMPFPIIVQTAKDDFTFELNVPPGQMVVRPILFPGWAVKSIRRGGVDITDSGVELASGQRLEGLDIVITSRLQVVTGLVTDSRGQPADAWVMFFAQDGTRWLWPTRYTAAVRTEQQGRFRWRTLPPGDYFAIALDQIDDNRRLSDPEYYKDLSQNAVKFSLVEGATRTLDLKLSGRK